METHSELRQDLVSGDWVIVVSGRNKRPHQFKQKEKVVRVPKKGCPFEDPYIAGGGEILLSYPNEANWKTVVVPNKFPVVTKSGSWFFEGEKQGPFHVIPGFGYHELMITKDHDSNLPKLSRGDAFLVFKAFRERYQNIAMDKNLAYVAMYHNWGPRAGASVYHPHYHIS